MIRYHIQRSVRNTPMIRVFFKKFSSLFLIALALCGSSCERDSVIINNVEEREANEIIVFLASRGISSSKTAASTSGSMGGPNNALVFNIAVESTKATEAMALLNQNGLPRKKGTTLLELFAKQSLMSSDKEETIRYQAGLAEEIAGMIRKIDGIIDAEVQLAFPPAETGITVGAPAQVKVSASVYIKHQGVLDDPNSHLVTKIKRLVSASVSGLDVNDVTVIPDRARFTDLSLEKGVDGKSMQEKDYVSIWSIVMNKQSASKFRFLFFTLTFAFLIFALMTGWLVWKFYPLLKKPGGWRELLHLEPFKGKDEPPENRSGDRR